MKIIEIVLRKSWGSESNSAQSTASTTGRAVEVWHGSILDPRPTLAQQLDSELKNGNYGAPKVILLKSQSTASAAEVLDRTDARWTPGGRKIALHNALWPDVAEFCQEITSNFFILNKWNMV